MAKRRTDEQKYEAYELLANAAISLHAGAGTCPKQRAFNIRQVCNGLYDTPSTHTGLVSEEGQHLKKSAAAKIKLVPYIPKKRRRDLKIYVQLIQAGVR